MIIIIVIEIKLLTECICSRIHSTNPLPPIPSASDSIKAAKPTPHNHILASSSD